MWMYGGLGRDRLLGRRHARSARIGLPFRTGTDPRHAHQRDGFPGGGVRMAPLTQEALNCLRQAGVETRARCRH